MAILKTHDLTVGFGRGNKKTSLLFRLNLKLEQGHLVALIGRNGAGKSTLIKALTCDTVPIEGYIEIDGKRSVDITKRQLSKLIALVATEDYGRSVHNKRAGCPGAAATHGILGTLEQP